MIDRCDRGDRYDNDLKQHDILKDVATGEFIRLTNGTCRLAHTDSEAYKEAHAQSGCRYVPFEGLVFVGDADNLVTWGMQNIQNRQLVKADAEDAAKVKAFFDRRINEIYEEDRRSRRRRKASR